MHCAVVHDTLENRGILGQLRARLRAEVFSALNDPTDSRPEVSRENFLINELIREYLDFNHYKYTASILTAGLYYKLYIKSNGDPCDSLAVFTISAQSLCLFQNQRESN